MVPSLVNRYRKMAKYVFGKILDVGCSQAFNPHLRDAVGFDITKPKELPKNYVKFVQGDAEKIVRYFPKNSFDCIVAGELIEHLENPFNFIKGCKKILKPGGLLILSTPTPFYWKTIVGDLFFQKGKRNSLEHKHVFVPRLLNTILDSLGFKLVKIERGIPLVTWQIIYVYKKQN